jgi:hypothetical protein
LVVAAHLLNELAGTLDIEGRTRLILGWFRELLEMDGTCILIEPALRETSRKLLAVRDRLLAAGLFVVAPCLWQGPCPALARERDFCHASAAAIAQGRSRVDFSYLVLRKQGTTCTDPLRFRIVSDAMKDKGRMRFHACGPAGRLLVTRLDRDRSPSNQSLDEIERGAVVSIEAATRKSDGLRCGIETAVRVLGQAGFRLSG